MLRRVTVSLLLLAAVLLLTGYAALRWQLHDPHPALQLPPGTLAIRDARIYVSPDDPPLDHASILIRDGRIAAVGPQIDIPAGTPTLPCVQCIVTAGFWNAHVHFTERHWAFNAFRPAAPLEAHLQSMLTSRGFTTVVDVGSNPYDTVSLRRRIETGQLLGPFIYSALAAQYPPHGIPFYLRNTLPKPLQKFMPQPATPLRKPPPTRKPTSLAEPTSSNSSPAPTSSATT